MKLHSLSWGKAAVAAFFLMFGSALPAWAQAGLFLTGSGPVNRSMGGAAVAAPLDATGSLFWNPATSPFLDRSEIDVGLEIVYPQSRLASSVVPNSLGRGIPPVPLSGSDRGDNGVFPGPSFAVVYQEPDSALTWGLGAFVTAGFGVNYPASLTNPILTPQPPVGLGLGSVYSQLYVYTLTPTVALKLSDRLSVGFGPMLDLADLRASPAFLSPPNLVSGFPVYADATHTRFHWGGGFQLGTYLTLDGGWQFGAAVRSPQWFEDFRFNSTNGTGLPRTFTQSLDLPMIVSFGVGYSGFDRWLLAADFRYIDFRNEDPFRQSGFDPLTGAVRGLGWRDIFAMSLGAQYRLTDSLALRAGYSFNENPISDAQAVFNIASPLLLEHALYVGFSYRVSECFSVTGAYAHGFQNSVSGAIITPRGTVPGSSVESVVSADTFLIGASVQFGCKPDRCAKGDRCLACGTPAQ